MRRTDREALELAIEWQKARGADRREQLEHIVARDGWEEAAQFCAYSAQMAALRLKPWEAPPCWASIGDGTAAGELLERMLAAGISRYHPDPEGALAEAALGLGDHP
jgi:hypothetical protein